MTQTVTTQFLRRIELRSSSFKEIKTKVVSLGSRHHVNKIKLANLNNRCVVNILYVQQPLDGLVVIARSKAPDPISNSEVKRVIADGTSA